jgi:iron complex outermembrane recepter protein
MKLPHHHFARTGLAAAVLFTMPAIAQQLQLEEVIVTAQKREQTLQDIPGSVAAITSEMMDKTVTTNFNDIGKITSGLTIGGGADGFGKLIRIRGVGTNSFVASIRPAVGIFLNEVPLGAPEMAYNNLADIERVEVLKGPQATLFGKEVSSGAIAMHTRKPHTDEIDGYIEGNFGNLELAEIRGGVNLPLSSDFALRVSGYYNERGETVRNATVPGKPGGAYDQTGYRARLLWQPTDTFEAILSWEDHENESGGTLSVPQQYGDLYQTVDQVESPDNSRLIVRDPADRVTDSSDPGARDTDSSMWSLNMSWDITDEWSLTSVTSDQEWEQVAGGDTNEYDTSDTSVGPYTLNHYINKPGTDTFTQELRATYSGERWSSIIGAFYAETDTVNHTSFAQLVGLIPAIDLSVTAAGVVDLVDDTQEWAVFTHNIYSLTDSVDLTIGARYSEVEKDSQKGQVTGVGPLAELNSPLIPANTWGDDIPVQSDTWDEVTGTLKLSYHLNDDMTLYAGWDRGFKAGGHNVCKNEPGGDAPLCPEPFDSETADNFEIGFKGRFLDRTLSLTTALFHQTFDDYQVEIQDDLGIGNTIQNAASVEIQGVEAEFVWLVGEHLSFDGNVSYLDATWDEYTDAGCIRPQYQAVACTEVITGDGQSAFVQDLSGEPLNYAPDWSYNLNATWSDTLGERLEWYIRGEVAFRDEVYFFPDLDPDAVGGDYTLFNASLGLSAADLSWQVIVWGKNLADEDYLVSASPNFDSGDPRFGNTPVEGYRVVAGIERTYGITLKYSF